MVVLGPLLLGPHPHLEGSGHCKEPSEEDVTGHREGNPGGDLASVVWSDDQVEETSFGLLVGPVSRLPQRGQVEVRLEVGELEQGEESHSSVELELGSGRVERVVGEIAHQRCESPVITAVLEEVGEWHRVPAE